MSEDITAAQAIELAEQDKLDFNSIPLKVIGDWYNEGIFPINNYGEMIIGGRPYDLENHPAVSSLKWCDYHGRWEWNDYWEETADGLVCSYPFNAHYVYVESDEQYHHVDDVVEIDGEYYLKDDVVYSDYHSKYLLRVEAIYSERYDDWFYEDDLVYDDYYDDYVLPEDIGQIHEYGYQPYFEVRKLSYENTTVLGFELELQTEYDQKETARDLMDSLGRRKIDDRVYFCWDGSVSAGFEIITQPATLRWMHEHKFVHLLMQAVNENDMYDDEETGLHVHVTNTEFDKNKLNRYRLARFVNKYWNKLYPISHREPNQYCDVFTESEIDGLKDEYYEPTRYRLVNFRGIGIEYRMFQATTREKDVIYALQFAESLTDFIAEGYEVDWDKYLRYIRHRYGNLYKKLIGRYE